MVLTSHWGLLGVRRRQWRDQKSNNGEKASKPSEAGHFCAGESVRSKHGSAKYRSATHSQRRASEEDGNTGSMAGKANPGAGRISRSGRRKKPDQWPPHEPTVGFESARTTDTGSIPPLNPSTPKDGSKNSPKETTLASMTEAITHLTLDDGLKHSLNNTAVALITESIPKLMLEGSAGGEVSQASEMRRIGPTRRLSARDSTNARELTNSGQSVRPGGSAASRESRWTDSSEELEVDEALVSRFQKIGVESPSPTQSDDGRVMEVLQIRRHPHNRLRDSQELSQSDGSGMIGSVAPRNIEHSSSLGSRSPSYEDQLRLRSRTWRCQQAPMLGGIFARSPKTIAPPSKAKEPAAPANPYSAFAALDHRELNKDVSPSQNRNERKSDFEHVQQPHERARPTAQLFVRRLSEWTRPQHPLLTDDEKKSLDAGSERLLRLQEAVMGAQNRWDWDVTMTRGSQGEYRKGNFKLKTSTAGPRTTSPKSRGCREEEVEMGKRTTRTVLSKARSSASPSRPDILSPSEIMRRRSEAVQIRASGSSGSFTDGVASTTRFHGSKPVRYRGGNLVGAGVSLRSSATEDDKHEEVSDAASAGEPRIERSRARLRTRIASSGKRNRRSGTVTPPVHYESGPTEPHSHTSLTIPGWWSPPDEVMDNVFAWGKPDSAERTLSMTTDEGAEEDNTTHPPRLTRHPGIRAIHALNHRWINGGYDSYRSNPYDEDSMQSGETPTATSSIYALSVADPQREQYRSPLDFEKGENPHPHMRSEQTRARAATEWGTDNAFSVLMVDSTHMPSKTFNIEAKSLPSPESDCAIQDSSDLFTGMKEFSHVEHIMVQTNARSKVDEPYACSQCPKRFDKQYQLNRHITRKHVRRYVCEELQCGRAFNLRADLARHIQSCHAVVRTQYRCQNAWCSTPDKLFSRKDNLRRHEKRCCR